METIVPTPSTMGIDLGSRRSETTPEEGGLPSLPDRQRLLRFDIGLDEHVLLPVTQILDVFPISPSDVLAMPQVAEWVMGLYNRRGSIVWMIDLGYLLGGAPIPLRPGIPWMGISLSVSEQVVGLVVHQVLDIEWHERQQVQPPLAGLFDPLIAQVLQGYVMAGSFMTPEVLLLLNPAALMTCLRKVPP